MEAKICVTGGAGYIGSKLVPALLEKGYKVVVLDLYLYGKNLKKHPNLTEIKGDIRDLSIVDKAISGCDSVIHLASISNDPSFDLDPSLGKSINFDSFGPFVKLCKRRKTRRFIFASSSSVYGIKPNQDVVENIPLDPITDYAKYKAKCEKVLFSHMDDNFVCTALRPSTVCGYAPRQRLDIVVNILTNFAYHKDEILVLGGQQMRPSIHIDDMVRAYLTILEAKQEVIQGQSFNIGFENYRVIDLAKLVQKHISKATIKIVPSNDQRSYHINSDKFKEVLSFSPIFTVEDAIKDLISAFKQKKLPNPLSDIKYFNVQLMKAIDLK